MTANVDVQAEFADFSGQIVTPTDSGYDEARRVYNAMIDSRRR